MSLKKQHQIAPNLDSTRVSTANIFKTNLKIINDIIHVRSSDYDYSLRCYYYILTRATETSRGYNLVEKVESNDFDVH